MRLLIHGLNFAPELTGIGKYTGEMAAYLENHGYEVRVITTPPYYPHWKVQPGYSGRSYRRETDQGVRILRCPLLVPRQPTGIKRILHLLSFAFSSFPAMLSQLSWRPHLVMSIAPAFACAPFSLLTARLARSRAWLHIQDFEV